MKRLNDRGQLQQVLQAYQLGDVFHEPLLPHISLYVFDRGELIYSQDEPAEMLYVLVKGKIKIYTTSAEGRTLILSFKKPLEVIGDIEYVRSIPIINTVEAVSHVQMIGVPYRQLRTYGSDHAPLLRFLLEHITQKFYIKSNSMSFNLLHPVEVRLASYLLSVSYDESAAGYDGRLSTSSLKDVANLIGTSYRHLNRVIGKLCAEGLIERSQGFIRVKEPDRLRALANDNIYES